MTGGLSAEGLFQQEASDDLVHFLFGAFEEGGSPHSTCAGRLQEGLRASKLDVVCVSSDKHVDIFLLSSF